MLHYTYTVRLATKWICNVMYVSISKYLVSFQNCFGVLFRLCLPFKRLLVQWTCQSHCYRPTGFRRMRYNVLSSNVTSRPSLWGCMLQQFRQNVNSGYRKHDVMPHTVNRWTLSRIRIHLKTLPPKIAIINEPIKLCYKKKRGNQAGEEARS